LLARGYEVVTIAWLCSQLRNNLFFVPPDFQVGNVGEGCSMVAERVSVNIPRWLNVILDLNGVLCSCVQKSTVTRRDSQQKLFYGEGFVYSATIPTCVGPKAIYVRPGVAAFVRRVSGFVDITVWSSMMQSTASQVVDYLFHRNIKPVAVYGQESCDTIQVNNGEELKYRKSDKNIFLKTMSSYLFLREAFRYKENNTILIDDSPEKSILNYTGNAIFLKSWKHTVRNCLSDSYLCTELAPWLERLHKERQGEVAQFVILYMTLSWTD
jgi:hypothetical protein